jgi:hypothetical protein
LLAVVVGYMLRRLDEEPRWLGHAVYGALALSLAIGVAFWAGIIHGNGAYLPAFGVLSPEAYVARWLDEVVADDAYPDSEILAYTGARLETGARVLANHSPLPLYFAQDIVTGNWGDRVNVGSIEDEAALLDYLDRYDVDYLMVFKTDLARAEQDPGYVLPLFTRPSFFEEHAALVVETPRTYLYRVER